MTNAMEVLRHAYDVGGFTTRSDYARANVEAVAAAACQGLITTEVPGVGYGTVWRPTALGVDGLFSTSGTPHPLSAHGGLPDAFLRSLEGRGREPAILN